MSTTHNPLHARNLSKLPASARRMASAAADGSLEELVKICALVDFGALTKDEAELLLPVFYINLDPGPIPDGDALETIVTTRTLIPSITCAFMSLRALGRIMGWSPASDIWARVWPWVDFLHTYWAHLPAIFPTGEETFLTAEDETYACIDHSPLLLGLALNYEPTLSTLILATPGVRNIFARTWAAFLAGDSLTAAQAVIHLVGALISDIETPSNFEEIIDAVGGCHSELVALVIKHISYALEVTRKDIMVQLLALGAHFLIATKSYDTFTDALLSGGILPILITALNVVAGTTEHLTGATVLRGLTLLTHYLSRDPTYPAISQALQAGLLRLIVSCALKPITTPGSGIADPSPELRWLLLVVISRATVSYIGITQLQRFCLEERAADSAVFKALPLFQEWKVLAHWVESRSKLLDTWESAGRPSFMSCDNDTCGKIAGNREFRRCTGCQSATYCSHECQRADWRPSHRALCQSLPYDRQHVLENRLPSRERGFMCTLLDEAYLRSRFAILRDIVLFMHAHPDAPREFFVQFDFRRGDAQLSVLPRSGLAAGNTIPVSMQRCAQLHAILAGPGVAPHHWFPLRSSSKALEDGLDRIACDIPTGVDIFWYTALVDHKVRALIREMEGVVIEIH
ncbi:hypothetical protein DFH06DRAFT_458926 [Mycena polygramma]|nr:hypothetical protein DFH06DRAFT_458926 [Mycena polygramma]